MAFPQSNSQPTVSQLPASSVSVQGTGGAVEGQAVVVPRRVKVLKIADQAVLSGDDSVRLNL